MLAIHRSVKETVEPVAPVYRSVPALGRASIGARRNPASTRAIIAAAADILARDGVAGFSIDAIAREARCGKPTVYRWWSDKLALLIDLHADAMHYAPENPNDLVHFWRSTIAGPALRAMFAEAQSSPNGHARLRSALTIYGDAPCVAQVVFAWLTDSPAGDALQSAA